MSLSNSTAWSRREALVAAAATGVAVSAGGCEKIISRVTARLGQTVPDSVAVADTPDIDPAHHLLSRAAFGPWPGDIDRVRAMGASAWIDEQLNPTSLEDSLCDLRARRFEELEQAPGECYEYTNSKRQLFEVMVGFWTDHLNINIEKGDCIYLKPADDREVIRKYALGRFADLIRASATSPAMLVYLDGKANARATPKDIPNENYGRELLELHTLGVHGGYTQADVYETARCLTGWRLRTKFRRGTVYFDPKLHDDGPKQVLGHAVPAGQGEKDLDQVVDIVCHHAATARHIATKLVRRFVAEDAPAALVERVAAVFTEQDGQIAPMVRMILNSEEFNASRGGKFKPPFRYVVSALRALGADTFAHTPLIEYLVRMGQGVFQYPTPDGYPDKASTWMGTLMWRWNLALALAAGKVPSVELPLGKLVKAIGDGDSERLFRYFTGHTPTEPQKQALAEAVGAQAPDGLPREAIGLILASPAFQKY